MWCFNKYTSYFFRSLLFFLFFGYYINLTMFYHAHFVNGHLLGHSHLYKHDGSNKTPYESHSHSSSEYSFIQLLNEGNWKDTSVIVKVPNPTVSNFEYCQVYIAPSLNPYNYFLPQLRAPPVIC